MAGGDPRLPAEHVVCSVPPTPEFETKFGYCVRKVTHLLQTKPLGLREVGLRGTLLHVLMD